MTQDVSAEKAAKEAEKAAKAAEKQKAKEEAEKKKAEEKAEKEAAKAAEKAKEDEANKNASDDQNDQPAQDKTKPVSSSELEKGKVRVLSQVNMTLNDGTQLVIGKPALIPKEEYDRLKKDARGGFFKE